MALHSNAGPARLSRSIRIGWAVGEFAIASHMAIISIYLLFYLTEVHHIPAALAGTLILIPRLWNVLTDPLMGGISDRVNSRWGRRRPFLLAGAVVWALSYAAMFSIPENYGLVAKSAWFLSACIAVNTGLSLYHVPYSAMVPEMTRDTEERLMLIGYKEIAARFSVLVTVMASPLIVAAAPSAILGYRWVGAITGGGIFLSGLIAFLATAHAPSESFQPQGIGWREQLRTFRENRPLFRLCGVYLLSSASDAFYAAMMIYFITVTLHLQASLVGTVYPAASITAVVTTGLWAILGRRIGRKKACTIAFASSAAVFCIALAIPPDHSLPLFPFMVILGGCFAGVSLLPGTMTPDAVEYDEGNSGQRREGAIYGIWIFTQQTGMALGSFLVGIYLNLIGYRSGALIGDASHQAFDIKLGFTLVPAALLLAGIALLRRVETRGSGTLEQTKKTGGPRDGQRIPSAEVVDESNTLTCVLGRYE